MDEGDEVQDWKEDQQVTQAEEVKIGGKVEMVLRKVWTDRGINIYGYKFRLVEEG